MKAEIIGVGTEILLGDILNSDAQYVSKKLASLGIDVYYQSVVGDNSDRLKEVLNLAFKRADLIITTGGLGPTKDDLTKETVFDFLGKEAVVSEKHLNDIKQYYKKLNREMPENNLKQAVFPKDALIMPNNHGTAPGCIIEENNKIIAVFPGPPRELKPMFEESFIPYIKKFTSEIIYSKVLRVSGLGESVACELVQDILDKQVNPTVAPYAKHGEMIFRITAKSKNEEEAKKIIKPIEIEIRNRLGINIYGENDANLENEVAKLLVDNNITISTAESCTGGLLAAKLINYAGISSVFLDGAVTYSNEAKIKRLGVKKETLDKHTAISSEVAGEMAEGIAKTSNTDIGLSTTGVAGPTSTLEGKPVGLVYLGLYINGEVKTKELHLNGNRQDIRNFAVLQALDWLRREILSSIKK